MDNESLKSIINDLRKIGQTDEQIKTGFVAKGWPENQIEQLMDSIPSENLPIKRDNRTYIIVGSSLLLFFISILLFFLFRNFGSNSPTINSDSARLENRSDIKSETGESSAQTQQSLAPGVNLIAYTISGDQTEQVEIYDTSTHQHVSLPQELHDPEVMSYEIGPWSPNGLYLPILTNSTARKPPRKSMLYFYVANNNTILKVAEKIDPDYTNDPWAFSKMSYATAWSDEVTFAYDTEAKNDGILAKYVKKDGRKGEDFYPGRSVYHFERYSYKPGIGTFIDKQAGLYIDNAVEPFSLPGNFLGIFGNEVISYRQPNSADLYQFVNNEWVLKPEIKEKADKIRNSSMSEAEKVGAAMVLARPTDPSKVYATDINSKNSKEIFSQGPEWNIFSVRYIPVINSVILHYTDHDIYPTRERVVTINLAESNRSQELIIRDVKGLFELPGTQAMETGYSFSVTPDGQWVVLVLGDFIKTNTIDIVNVKTKERKTICNTGCGVPKVNTPVQFKEVLGK